MGKFLKKKQSTYRCKLCNRMEKDWPNMKTHLEVAHPDEKGKIPKTVQAAVDLRLVQYHYEKKNKKIVKRTRNPQTRAANNEAVRYKVQEIILPIYLRIPITLPSNVEIIQRPDDEENKE